MRFLKAREALAESGVWEHTLFTLPIISPLSNVLLSVFQLRLCIPSLHTVAVKMLCQTCVLVLGLAAAAVAQESTCE